MYWSSSVCYQPRLPAMLKQKGTWLLLVAYVYSVMVREIFRIVCLYEKERGTTAHPLVWVSFKRWTVGIKTRFSYPTEPQTESPSRVIHQSLFHPFCTEASFPPPSLLGRIQYLSHSVRQRTRTPMLFWCVSCLWVPGDTFTRVALQWGVKKLIICGMILVVDPHLKAAHCLYMYV